MTTPFVDVSPAGMLTELASTLRRDGVELRKAHDIGQVRDVLRAAAPGPLSERVYRTVVDALADPPPTGQRRTPDRQERHVEGGRR
jgi:hypothetical protein